MNLDTFIDRVRIETTHLSQTADPNSESYRQQLAMTLSAYVPIYLSSGIYSALLASGTPPTGVIQTLDTGAGICGHHVELAVNTLEALGVPWRDVQVFYRLDGEPRNHTVVEIAWGDKWRMVDVTWGFIPHEGSLDTALSWELAASRNHRIGLHNHSLPWRMNVEQQDEDVLSYLTPNADIVLYTGSGDFTIPVQAGDVELCHERVARAGSWNHLLGMISSGDIRLDVSEGSFDVSIEGVANHPGILTLAQHSIPIDAGSQLIEIRISGPQEYLLRFESDSGDGAVTIESVEIHPSNQQPSEGPTIASSPVS